VRPPRPDRRLREGGGGHDLSITIELRLGSPESFSQCRRLKRQASRSTMACAFCNGKPVATIRPMLHR